MPELLGYVREDAFLKRRVAREINRETVALENVANEGVRVCFRVMYSAPGVQYPNCADAYIGLGGLLAHR